MQSTIPNPFDINIIYNLLKDHIGLAVLAVSLFLVYKYAGDIGTFFKEYFNKRLDSESKRIDEIQKQNDKYFQLYENNTEAVKKVGEAIASIEKAFITAESRTSEKILGVETRLIEKISEVETRLTDRISSTTKEIVHHGKLEKISSTLDKLEAGDVDGTPK